MQIYIYLNYIHDTLLDMKICLQNEVDHIQSWTNPETFRNNFRIWQSCNPFSSSVQNGDGQKFLWLPVQEEGNKVWPPAFDIKKTPTALPPTLASRRKQVPSFPSQCLRSEGLLQPLIVTFWYSNSGRRQVISSFRQTRQCMCLK